MNKKSFPRSRRKTLDGVRLRAVKASILSPSVPEMPGARYLNDTLTKRDLIAYTKKAIAKLFNNYMEMSVPDLRAVGDSLDLPVLDVLIARALLKDRLMGELLNTEKILDRIIGKVPQPTPVLGSSDGIGGPLVPTKVEFVGVRAKSSAEEAQTT